LLPDFFYFIKKKKSESK